VIGEKLDHVRGISRKTREIGDAALPLLLCGQPTRVDEPI
jgi:hypothetical protein